MPPFWHMPGQRQQMPNDGLQTYLLCRQTIALARWRQFPRQVYCVGSISKQATCRNSPSTTYSNNLRTKTDSPAEERWEINPKSGRCSRHIPGIDARLQLK